MTKVRLQALRLSRSLRVILAGAAAFSLVLIPFIPDLGWNLLADAIALCFGLFVIDRALAQAAEEAHAPAHKAMVDDLMRLHRQVDRTVFLILRETATEADLDVIRAAARGDGDVAEIMARLPLAAPAPMRLIGWIGAPQMTWGQAIVALLSPTSLRLETLIARYIGTADVKMLAAIQGLESSLMMDLMRGEARPGGSHILAVFWRSLFQSMESVYRELGPAIDRYEDRGAIKGFAPYLQTPLHFLDEGVWAKERAEGTLKVYSEPPPI